MASLSEATTTQRSEGITDLNNNLAAGVRFRRVISDPEATAEKRRDGLRQAETLASR